MSTFSDWMAQSGAKGLSVGSCIDLRKAQQMYPDLIWQGNVSNQLLRDGSLTEITCHLAHQGATGGRSHILNLSHGLASRHSLPKYSILLIQPMLQS